MRIPGLLLIVCGAAAPADRWEQLAASAQRERPIGVEMRDGARHTGVPSLWDAQRLVLRRPGGDLSIERAQVKRITRRSRGKGVLIGVLAGFGSAFAAGTVAGPYVADIGNPSAGRRVKHGLGWGLFGAGVGAGIGALAGASQRIYTNRSD